MISRDRHTFADGSVKTQIRVRQTYRPYPGGPARRRTIRDFGYLEDHEDQEAFWREVNACNDSIRNERTERITVNTTQLLRPGERVTRNYGIWFGYSVCRQLSTSTFFGTGIQDDVFRYLVSDRMIFQDPIHDAITRTSLYYGTDALERETVFHMLGEYGSRYIPAVRALNQSVKALTGLTFVELAAEDPEWVREPDARRSAGPVLVPAVILDNSLKPVCVMPVHRTDSLAAIAAEVRESLNLGRCILLTITESGASEEMEQLTAQGDGFLLLQREQTVARAAGDGAEAWKVETDGNSGDGPSGKYRRVRFTREGPYGKPASEVSGVTSEGNASQEEIRQMFLMLRRMEGSLREICSTYDSRASYVNTREKTRGAFLVHLTALAAARIIQRKMKDERISVHRIAEVLQEARCMEPDWSGCVVMLEMLSDPKMWEDFIKIQKAFGSEYYYFISKSEDFNGFLLNLRLIR